MKSRTSTTHRKRPVWRTADADLQTLPGVGPSIARDLLLLGYRRAADLRSADPEQMYRRLCKRRRTRIDPCVLYTFRCAVYAAKTERPKKPLLQWWNWKDRTLGR